MADSDGSRGLVVASAVVSFVIVLGIIIIIAGRPQTVSITLNPPAPTGTPVPTPTHAPITVYVTGAVHQPGTLVSLPHGSRVSDALSAVGGVTDDADPVSVNLAGILRDGDQVHVASVVVQSVALPTPSGGDTLNLNTATQTELETLPGIGAVTAGRIIAYRESIGQFNSIDELANVAGVGSATVERLRPFLRLD